MKGSLVFLFCFLFRIDWKVIYINLKKEKIGNVIVMTDLRERERENFHFTAKNRFENFEKTDYPAFFYLPRKLIFLRSF